MCGLAFIASIGSTRTGSCALDHPDWPLDGLDDLRVSDQNRKIIENVRKLVHCKLPKARGFLKAKWVFDRRTRSRTRNWFLERGLSEQGAEMLVKQVMTWLNNKIL